MLQVSDMDGAVILTFSEPLTKKEREILNLAKDVKTDQKQNPVGAGGICWGQCAAKKDDYWEKQSMSPQGRNADVENELSILRNALSNAETTDNIEKLFDELGFEEILNPFADGVPF